ncbi:MAG: 4Fe-4S dicluster domain-containing protein [Anaerolineae bacterium]
MPPRVDRDLCVGCGICLFQCGQDVFSLDPEAEKAVVARPQQCVDCFICEKYCPEQAIRVKVGKPR